MHGRDGEMHNNILVGKRDVKKQMEDMGVDGKTILEWIVRRQDGKLWTECISLRIGTGGRLLRRR
jgi:hypothetical protein